MKRLAIWTRSWTLLLFPAIKLGCSRRILSRNVCQTLSPLHRFGLLPVFSRKHATSWNFGTARICSGHNPIIRCRGFFLTMTRTWRRRNRRIFVFMKSGADSVFLPSMAEISAVLEKVANEWVRRMLVVTELAWAHWWPILNPCGQTGAVAWNTCAI